MRSNRGLRWSALALVLIVLSCSEAPAPAPSDNGGTSGDGDGDGDGDYEGGRGGRSNGDGDIDLDGSTIDSGYCAPGSDGPECAPCTTGMYCPGNEPGEPCGEAQWDHDSNPATACRSQPMCPAGEQFADPGDATHQRTCEPCPSGSFAPNINTASCIEFTTCPPGQYIHTAGTAQKDQICRNCSGGMHSTEPNSTQCARNVACLAGATSTIQGCLPCDPGYYCAGGFSPGYPCGASGWDDDQDPSTLCVDHTICGPGTYSSEAPTNTSDRVCVACEAGFFTNRENASSCSAWRTCPSGQRVLLEGTDERNRTCEDCPAGQTSAGPNATECFCDGDAGACDPID